MLIDNTKIQDVSAAIERIPVTPSLFRSLNLYRTQAVRTDAVTFDVRDNAINAVLDDTLRNTESRNGTSGTPYSMHTLAIPFFPVERTLGRESLGNVRGFGKEAAETVAQAVADELALQRSMHDHQLEYMIAASTLTGQFETNYYGTYNFESEFGVTRETVELESGNLATGLREASRISKGGLQGAGTNGYILFAGVELFEQLINDSVVLDQLKYRGANSPLMNELGTLASGYEFFTLGNVTIIQYDDTFSNKDGSQIDLLAADAGVMVPRGTVGRIFHGPSSTLSGLGQAGSRLFARTFRDQRDRFIAVESEQASLVVPTNYGSTVNITMASQG